jgi:omega-amidase
MGETLNIAIVQFNVEWHEIKRNLNTIDLLLSSLRQPVDIILLPEMFVTGYTMQPELFNGDNEAFVLEWMKKTSNSQNASIMGTYPSKFGESYNNRLICISPNGKTEYYNKRHLFSMGDEDLHYLPGNERKIILINEWKIFPLICYDLRFPVWCRNNLSYDLLIDIANWPASRIDAWNILLKARAIENQCYVIGINRTGIDGRNISYNGNSQAISPKGEIIKRLDNSDQMILVELNLNELKHFREKFPVLKDQDHFDIK